MSLGTEREKGRGSERLNLEIAEARLAMREKIHNRYTIVPAPLGIER